MKTLKLNYKGNAKLAEVPLGNFETINFQVKEKKSKRQNASVKTAVASLLSTNNIQKTVLRMMCCCSCCPCC